MTFKIVHLLHSNGQLEMLKSKKMTFFKPASDTQLPPLSVSDLLEVNLTSCFCLAQFVLSRDSIRPQLDHNFTSLLMQDPSVPPPDLTND